MAQKPKQDQDEGLLVAAAKSIGKTAGKIAAVAGAKPQAEPPESPKSRNRPGRLAPKNKSRLPRRQKKQAKKHASPKRTRSAAL